MSLIQIYEQLKSRKVCDILAVANSNPAVQESVAASLGFLQDDDEVDVEDFVRAFASMDIKTKTMIDVFDDISDHGDYVTADILLNSLGQEAKLLFQDEEKIDLIAFLKLSDLFDDEGGLVGLPQPMLEQLNKVNQKLVELNLDVHSTEFREQEMSEQMHSMSSTHEKEKSFLVEAAAAVEVERDELYAELKDLRRSIHENAKANLCLEIPEDEYDGFAENNTPLSEEIAASCAAEVSDDDEMTETSTFMKKENVVYSDIAEQVATATDRANSPLIEYDSFDDEPTNTLTEEEVLYSDIADNTSTTSILAPIEQEAHYCKVQKETNDVSKEAGDQAVGEGDSLSAADVWSAANYNTMPWYRENATRTEAEAELTPHGAGKFVVRKSSQHDGWAMSIRGFKNDFIHYLVKTVQGGVALQYVENGTPKTVEPVCKTLVDLVTHFSKTTINDTTPVLFC